MNAFLKKQNLKLPLPQSKRGFAITWQKVVTGVIVLAILVAVFNIFQAPIKNGFYYITSPISKTLWGAGESTSGVFSYFSNSGGVLQENSNLKQENQNLLSQVSALQDTVKQDEAIKEVVQNTQADKFTLATAQAIGLDSAHD